MPSRLRAFRPRAATFCAELKSWETIKNIGRPSPLTKSGLKSKFPGQLDPKQIWELHPRLRLGNSDRSCERYNRIQNFLINLPPINCFRAADFGIGVGLPRDWPVMSCVRFVIVLRPTQLHWHQSPDSAFRRWRYTAIDRCVLLMEWPDRWVWSFQKKRFALWGSVSSFTLPESFSSEYDHQLCISHLLFADSRVHTKYLSYSAFPIYFFAFPSPQNAIKQLCQQSDAIALFIWQWFVDVN
jgi:hypothetical protein